MIYFFGGATIQKNGGQLAMILRALQVTAPFITSDRCFEHAFINPLVGTFWREIVSLRLVDYRQNDLPVKAKCLLTPTAQLLGYGLKLLQSMATSRLRSF